jgi:hypothetical protein
VPSDSHPQDVLSIVDIARRGQRPLRRRHVLRHGNLALLKVKESVKADLPNHFVPAS